MKIKSLDRSMVVELADEALEAVQDWMKEYGIEVNRKGSVSYDHASMTFKLELRTSAGMNIKSQQSENSAIVLGFAKSPIGERFNSPTPGGKARWYVITEINLRRHQYPITAKRESNGKSFKFKSDYVKRQLGARTSTSK